MANDGAEQGTVITARDGEKRFERPTGNAHQFVLSRFRAQVLDVEDIHFHFDSAVFLPDFGDCGANHDPADQNRVTGLAVVRSVYLQSGEHPEQKILIAGHTDRSGSDAYNLELSRQRADNVLHVLQGDRAAWVRNCQQKHQVEDYQQILKWVHVIWDWDCDPGAVDNVHGPKTQNAVKTFQRQYNAGTKHLPEGFSANVAVDGVVGAQTWGAFFDVYIRVLEIVLAVDPAGLKANQQGLHFVDAGRKTVGCGENHPLTANVVANRRSQIDRRVEVLFFDPAEEPLLDCHPSPGTCAPDACEIYRNKLFRLNPIPCRPMPRPSPIGSSDPIIFFLASARDAGTPAPPPAAAPGDGGAAPAADAGAPSAAPAPAPAPPAAAPAPAPAPGTAPAAGVGQIAPNSQVVVVPKPHTNPARVPVQLRASNPFTGAGMFTRSRNNIRFFTAAVGGTEITFNGTDNRFTDAQLIAGHTVFAHGDSPSTAVNDVELTLTLLPLNSRTTARMTAVDVTLDICQSRTASGTDPTALSAADKINVGRTVHMQDTGNHHGRAMLIVRQVRPSAFAGNLTLAPLNARVRIFAAADEVAAAGQAVLANPHVFAASTVPAAGLRFWAEGVTASPAVRDAGVRLGVENVEPEADRVVMTVGRLRRLEADVPSTRARTARMGNSPVARHFMRRGTGAAPDPTNYDVDFTSNPPLLLIQNAVQAARPIRLGVQVEPAGLPVLWSVQRDTRPAPDGDHADVIALSPSAIPTLTPDGGDPLKATLLSDAVGSFHIRPYIDCNGNSTFEGNDAGGSRIDREPFIIMNLVLVSIALHRDDSIARDANLTAAFTGGGGIGVTSGAFNIAVPAGEAIHMNVLANLVGGGANGRRGLNLVFGGWVNDESANEDIAGTFNDTGVAPPVNRRSFSVFASNPAAATGPNNRFLPGDPAPALVAPSLLDTGRGTPGTGGDTATLTRSRIRTRTNLAVGERWLVEAIDSPGDGEGGTHPGFATARLVRFRFHLDFRAYLCFWTNTSGTSGASVHAANRLYSVLREFTWRMRGEWTIAGGVLTVVTVPTVRTSGSATHSPPVPAATTTAETRPPTGLNLLARDARA